MVNNGFSEEKGQMKEKGISVRVVREMENTSSRDWRRISELEFLGSSNLPFLFSFHLPLYFSFSSSLSSLLLLFPALHHSFIPPSCSKEIKYKMYHLEGGPGLRASKTD